MVSQGTQTPVSWVKVVGLPCLILCQTMTLVTTRDMGTSSKESAVNDSLAAVVKSSESLYTDALAKTWRKKADATLLMKDMFALTYFL